MSVGLLTDSSWGGAARTLPPAPAGQQQEVAPVGRYELLTDLQVGGRGTGCSDTEDCVAVACAWAACMQRAC